MSGRRRNARGLVRIAGALGVVGVLAGCEDSTGPSERMPDGEYEVRVSAVFGADNQTPGWVMAENRINIRKAGEEFQVLRDSRGLVETGPASIVIYMEPRWNLHISREDGRGWYHVRVNAESCVNASVRDHVRDRSWSAACEIAPRSTP